MEIKNYHSNILEGTKDSSHPYVRQALEFIPNFVSAIETVIENGDWSQYAKSVEPYDKFLWEKYYDEKQKTNPINIGQNKIFSSYRESLLFPLWYRIKKSLPFETNVILNKPIIQTIYTDGTTDTKDVDGGLYITCEHNGNTYYCPVIVDEDKGGHFCATTASNVNSIFRKFKDTNPNILTIATTDNNVSIGKEKDCNFMQSTNCVFSIRGKNGEPKKKYSSLWWERFDEVEKVLIKKLNDKSENDFICEKMNSREKSDRKIRDIIDNHGILFNF